MDMQGEARIPAPKSVVWDALNDPEVLKASIAGCEELVQEGDDGFTAKVRAKVGPVSARFSGKVRLVDIDAPNGYRIEGEGAGGAAGFAKGGAVVRLQEEADGGTLLTYEANANVGGKLAQIGARLIDGAARKMADDFFTRLSEIAAERAGDATPEPEPQPEPEEPEPEPQQAATAAPPPPIPVQSGVSASMTPATTVSANYVTRAPIPAAAPSPRPDPTPAPSTPVAAEETRTETTRVTTAPAPAPQAPEAASAPAEATPAPEPSAVRRIERNAPEPTPEPPAEPGAGGVSTMMWVAGVIFVVAVLGYVVF